MNLRVLPVVPLRLLGTATASPLDLPTRAGGAPAGVELNDEQVFERVLGPAWHAQLSADEQLTKSQPARTRQWLQGDATALDLGLEAARRVLATAGLMPSDLSAVICVTSTPPLISASMAARIARELGCTEHLSHASAWDVRAGGVGVMLAWFSAQGLIVQGSGPVLIVAAEASSAFMRPDDLGSALLYADGAGACILAPGAAGEQHFLGGLSGQTLLQGRPTTIPGILPPTGGDEMAYRFQRPDRAHLQDLQRLWRAFPQELAKAYPLARNELAFFLPYAVTQVQMEAAMSALDAPRARLFHQLNTLGCVGAASPLVTLHGLLQSGEARAGDVIALASAAGNGLWAGFFWRL